jgi:non-ribosomal peptide synthetase-like protein
MDTLDRLFAAAVRDHAERVAIERADRDGNVVRSVTYRELDRLAAGIAATLPGGAAGTVFVLLPRGGVEVYAAQLAITRRGHAFCCADASFPDPHLRATIADARPVAVVTDGAGMRRLGPMAGGVAMVDATAVAPAEPGADLGSGPGSLAYLIYTSGTTGTPKGVMIEHRSIANLVASDLRRFRIGPGDRVAQGSSNAYDSSVEETWLALASGATLVPVDDEIVRSGPDLPAWLRAQRISVFCPPPTLLRAMGVADPRRELPDLRLVYVGGEALPQDLSDLWSDATWLENGYGPTECTVTVTRGRMRPGVPVHIGVAVEGNDAFVVGEDGREVPDGAEGELCIAGVSVSRGYRDRPDETARRFGPVAGRDRAYRTGDLVRRRPGGELEYLGRIDGQVKLRGYRIELGAVEACLVSHPAVAEAACAVAGSPARARLGALVTLRPGATLADPSRELAAWVRERLPAAMAPAVALVAQAIPVAVSGKVDRRAVAAALESLSGAEAPADLARLEAIAADPARPPVERFAACMARALGLAHPPAADADFFVDLGGDSLRAVELLLWVRRRVGSEVSVRDLYAHPTASGLVAASAVRRPDAVRIEVAARRRRTSPGAAAAAQAALLGLGFVVTGAIAFAGLFLAVPWGASRFGTLGFETLAALVTLLVAALRLPVGLALTVAAKRLLVGRFVPGRVEAWGGRYLREWTVERVAAAIPWSLVEGTELHGWTLRRLGARVGRRVHLHRGVNLASGGWDLLEIGDDAIVERDAAVLTGRVQDGGVERGPVRIGSGAVVGIRATLEPGCTVGAGAEVEPLSLVRGGEAIPAGERWGGVPAARRGEPRPAPVAPVSRWGPWSHAALVIGARLSAAPIAVFTVVGLWLAFVRIEPDALGAWLDRPSMNFRLAVILVLAGIAAAVTSLVLAAFALRWIGPIRPGLYPRHGPAAARIAWRVATVEAAGRWLSGTLLWPIWLRVAGMRIGKGSEVSTILDALPETLSIGSMSFFADGVYLAGPEIRASGIAVRATSLGDETFLGNHGVIPAGIRYPDRMFVGVATVPPADAGPGEGWFGTPPMALPRREIVAVDRRLTHEPGLARRISRWSWELSRIAVATPATAVGLGWFVAVERALAAAGPWATAFVWAPLASLAAWLALIAFGLAAKWLLLGRVKPGVHGLWSCWCSRWDYLYVLWWFSARLALRRLEGTPLLNVVLRLAGTRIGRDVLLGAGATQIVDPDMLDFGDRSTVACHFQAHSFEDRVLKIDRVRIGADANAGENAVVFYGAEIGKGATLEAGSVLMKRGKVADAAVACGSPVG